MEATVCTSLGLELGSAAAKGASTGQPIAVGRNPTVKLYSQDTQARGTGLVWLWVLQHGRVQHLSGFARSSLRHQDGFSGERHGIGDGSSTLPALCQIKEQALMTQQQVLEQ